MLWVGCEMVLWGRLFCNVWDIRYRKSRAKYKHSNEVYFMDITSNRTLLMCRSISEIYCREFFIAYCMAFEIEGLYDNKISKEKRVMPSNIQKEKGKKSLN